MVQFCHFVSLTVYICISYAKFSRSPKSQKSHKDLKTFFGAGPDASCKIEIDLSFSRLFERK